MTVVVTSFPGKHWDEYVRPFIETAELFWPDNWTLIAYTDADWCRSTAKVQYRPLPDSVAVFQAMCGDKERGLVPQPCWSAAEVKNGYSYRTDAARFCHKPFALLDYVSSRLVIDKSSPFTVFWLDADVITIRRIPENLFENWLPEDKAVARLARPYSYSETGWLGFRLPIAKTFFKKLADLYLTKDLYKFSQWHDSWAIDQAIRMKKIPTYDLASMNHGNIWDHSHLRHCFIHLKGKRKYDPEIKLKTRKEIYQNTGVKVNV